MTEEEMKDLGCCPFCGSRKVHESRDPKTNEPCIACQFCDIMVKTWLFESNIEELRRKFNKRNGMT